MGHTVIRPPNFHYTFNPIEHMWHELKSKVRSEYIFPTLSSSVVELIKECVHDVPPDTWKNSVRHEITVDN